MEFPVSGNKGSAHLFPPDNAVNASGANAAPETRNKKILQENPLYFYC